MAAQKYIRWFSEISKNDISHVGGKGANLGEMTSFGIPVPPGFVVTSEAYFYFIEKNDIKSKMEKIVKLVDANDPMSFTVASVKIKKLILESQFPNDLALEIMKSYLKLGGGMKNALVAVRSSATAEDLPTASFAGQQATFLNVSGEANLVKKVQECYASLFEPRAIFYRVENKFDHFKVGIAVPVQKMIQSEQSGVMFTTNPVTQEKNRIIIEAIYGLGEMIVQGEATPDRYIVDKESNKILSKDVFSQPIQLIKVGSVTKKVAVKMEKRNKQKITDNQVKEIAKLGKKIHHHYFFPQDIEWAIEGKKVYIVQTRPITTLDKDGRQGEIEKEKANADIPHGKLLLKGMPASPGIATGRVKKISSPKEIGKVIEGDILVISMTTPDFVPAMKKVSGIITDRGGQTSHAAIVSRELGVPCIVGTGSATKVLKTGEMVTMNAGKGEIYKPIAADKNKVVSPSFTIPDTFSLSKDTGLVKTATKVYVNLAEPELATEVAKKNVDGVGLLRAEFMMAQMGVHPKKLIHDGKQKMFVDGLESGLRTFCEQFSPRPVVYRASDFKTNEYRSLTGGEDYEPIESNPMLGFRGAYRYLSDAEMFELELEAIKKVREDYKNLHLMIPFVHMPWELIKVKKIIASKGLLRSPLFKLWMMVEIPSNVILLDDFIQIGIDGVSIGSNDLTMLIMGVDRDNNEVAPIFNENNPAVLWALEKVIKTCHKYKITSSICGQAPSTYPELVEKLVEWGVTSVSVNPDAVDHVRQTIYDEEKRLIGRKNV